MDMKRAVRALRAVALSALLVGQAACTAGTQPIEPGTWAHIVVVWEENKDASEVRDLPYISELRAAGLTFSRCYGVARPSQPNYIAVFAGSTLGVTDNNDHDLSGPTLYSRYADAGLSMVSYAEDLPWAGFRGSASSLPAKYVRKHNPAASFPTVPDAAIQPFTAFPADAAGFASLPELSFVIPNLDNDMHDGSMAQADTWLRDRLGAYADWARSNGSLLILTFDEPNTASGSNLSAPILTLFVGDGLEAGAVDGRSIDLYRLSDYLLDCFGLARLTP